MSMFLISETLLQDRGAPTQAAPPSPATSWYASIKYVLEFVIALFLLILTAPLILFAIILIKLTSPGPVIYSQTRIGLGGKPFTIYKLRTMTHDCESLTGPQWATPGDGRVTPVGRWLRKLHIDELPQLWNVLIGDMSLIGPRPERPEFLPQLEQAIPLYRQRLDVRPGITGFAQIQLPPDSEIDDVRIKLAYDLHYVHHLGFWLDVSIYFGTVLKLIGLTYDAIRSMCWFPLRDAVDDEYRSMIDTASRAPQGAG
ncbi:MAG: sugar transferase [Planctomycetes bacterium]|nr:sugar transferase [Planctomycetota bacterium]